MELDFSAELIFNPALLEIFLAVCLKNIFATHFVETYAYTA